MPEYLLGLLIFAPFILAAMAFAVCWRRIFNRLLFLVTAVLALLGLQALIAPGAIYVLLPGPGELTKAAAHEAFVRTVTISGVAQIVLGLPFLWWLYRGFRKPDLQSEVDADGRQSM